MGNIQSKEKDRWESMQIRESLAFMCQICFAVIKCEGEYDATVVGKKHYKLHFPFGKFD